MKEAKASTLPVGVVIALRALVTPSVRHGTHCPWWSTKGAVVGLMREGWSGVVVIMAGSFDACRSCE